MTRSFVPITGGFESWMNAGPTAHGDGCPDAPVAVPRMPGRGVERHPDRDPAASPATVVVAIGIAAAVGGQVEPDGRAGRSAARDGNGARPRRPRGVGQGRRGGRGGRDAEADREVDALQLAEDLVALGLRDAALADGPGDPVGQLLVDGAEVDVRGDSAVGERHRIRRGVLELVRLPVEPRVEGQEHVGAAERSRMAVIPVRRDLDVQSVGARWNALVASK